MKIRIWVVFFSVLLLSGCSRWVQRTPDRPPDPAALELIRFVKSVNAEHKSFKGVGRIRIWRDDRLFLSERVTWIGAESLKFRIEILFSGQSLIKVASDGKWLYFFNRSSENYPYGRLLLTKESLAKVLRVPVDPVDFNLILSGRIPLHPHDHARLQQDPDRQEIVLTLEKGWDGVVEKLYLDKAARVVRQVEMFDASGSLSYRIEYQRYQAFGRIRMPGRLMISTEQGDRLRLDIGRYETDVPVDEGLFVLSAPP